MSVCWFGAKYLTVDETSIHYYDPEFKQYNAQWHHQRSPLPYEFKVQTSVGKPMATIVWGREESSSILLSPANTHDHQTLLCKANSKIKEYNPRKEERNIYHKSPSAPEQKNSPAKFITQWLHLKLQILNYFTIRPASQILLPKTLICSPTYLGTCPSVVFILTAGLSRYQNKSIIITSSERNLKLISFTTKALQYNNILMYKNRS